MRKLLTFTLLSFISIQVIAQTDANMGIIPVPVSVVKKQGNFELDKTVVLVSADAANARVADLLNAFIVTKAGFALRESKTTVSGSKAIVLTSVGADELPAEGYKIIITPKQFTIIGKSAGLFYGLQSAMQLMPEPAKRGGSLLINAVEINDYPRFKYRGLHLM